MTFHDDLLAATDDARRAFLSIPVIGRAIDGGVDRPLYLRFLASAYHHVRFTVPLLEAALERCGPGDAALAAGLREYVGEEIGHDEWILDDIRDLGGDAEAVRGHKGPLAVRLMVAYAFHTIREDGPWALLGMVHVLEGMSVALAVRAADAIRARLQLSGGGGFSYLTSHGALDVSHVAAFAALLDAIDTPAARTMVAQSARDFYRLYGDVFRELEDGHAH